MRVVLICVAGVVAAGCGSETRDDAGRTSVAAAFYPIAYAAQQVGRDTVEVDNLTPPGVEPHDLELSARDVERVRSADVVLYLGSGFQPSFERAANDAEGEVVDLLRGAKSRSGDPHIWLDPLRYGQIVRRIGTVLSRPTKGFEARLGRLDDDFRRGLEQCERREIVTSHAAYGYLAERYRLEQVALTGLSPEAEPTARELERLIATIRQRHATTVFFEPLVSRRLADTIARDSGATTAVLNPIEGLSEDELDAGEDYFSIMRRNLRTLQKALGCR